MTLEETRTRNTKLKDKYSKMLRFKFFIILFTLNFTVSVWADDENNLSVVQESGDAPQVVLIGDSHGDHRHYSRAVDIINRFAKPGDIILNEGGDYSRNLQEKAQKSVGTQFNRLKLDLDMTGWDSPIAQQWATEFQNAAGDAMSKGEVFGAIYLRIMFQIDLVERNKFMARAIRDALKASPGRTVFVIAGTNHVLEEKLLSYLKETGISHKVYARDTTKTVKELQVMETKIAEYEKLLKLDSNPKYPELIQILTERHIARMYEAMKMPPLSTLKTTGANSLYQPHEICLSVLRNISFKRASK